MLDTIVALGAIAAIIAILPPLGIDIRIFGRKRSIPSVGSSIPRWRWWLVMVIACMSLLGTGYSLYTKSTPTEKEWLEMVRDGHLKQIRNQNLPDQVIELDGKDIRDCQFLNPTFIYRGEKPFILDHNQFSGHVVVKVTYGPQQAGMALAALFNPICQSIRCDFYGVTSKLEPMPSH
jgi:hypothetical protein